MRLIAITALCVIVAGCAATQEQVTAALGSKYIGRSVDQLVLEFGPPASTFKMSAGSTAYQWELANHTKMRVNDYGGSASTLYCRVRAIAGADNIVRSVSTEDASNVVGESLCAKRLGIMRQEGA